MAAVIEFRSVVDAVRCALEVQHAMVERNAGVPLDKRIEFRIGIHLGDVVEESDGDLMGDGVNIATRLEGIAAPGAICLSEDAYRQVSGRLDMAVTDLGPTELKNIERSIRVYSLQVGVPAQAKPATPPTIASSALPRLEETLRLGPERGGRGSISTKMQNAGQGCASPMLPVLNDRTVERTKSMFEPEVSMNQANRCYIFSFSAASKPTRLNQS
jgi:hypothetical protein